MRFCRQRSNCGRELPNAIRQYTRVEVQRARACLHAGQREDRDMSVDGEDGPNHGRKRGENDRYFESSERDEVSVYTDQRKSRIRIATVVLQISDNSP